MGGSWISLDGAVKTDQAKKKKQFSRDSRLTKEKNVLVREERLCYGEKKKKTCATSSGHSNKSHIM